jgi:hypothetical protein
MMKLLIATGFALAAITAFAAEEPIRAVDRPMTKQEARFRALDANNDRQLSPQEFQADATSQTEFAKLDTDADGFLSMSEFIARPLPPAKTPTEPK